MRGVNKGSFGGFFMSNHLQVFNFNGSDIREITDKSGNPWFVAKDIATVLGYANPRKAVLDHCKKAFQVGGNKSLPLDPQTKLIPESDLYRLVLRSKLPEAEKFEDWVTSDVLPSIRKTGAYSIQQSDDEIVRTALLILDKKVKALESKIEEDRPKVQFFQDVTGSKDAIEMGKVAKVIDCGMGRNKLFEFLRKNEVLMMDNEPYQKYIDAGWFRIIEQKYRTPSGDVRISIKTLVYQRGIDGILKLIKQFA